MNHAIENWYQPGQRLQVVTANLSGSFTVPADGTWYDITGLSINYTPEIRVAADIHLYCNWFSNSASYFYVYFQVLVNGSPVRHVAFRNHHDYIQWPFHAAVYYQEYEAGTTYTIKARIRGDGSQPYPTLYVPEYTESAALVVVPYAHP